jgi:ribosome-associated protein
LAKKNDLDDLQKRLRPFINALLEKKAGDPVVLNVKKISDFADCFIICGGASDRQVRAISSSIQENLKKIGIYPLGTEGEAYGQWVLLDYGDVIIHVFLESVRTFYDLERLWSEAVKIPIPIKKSTSVMPTVGITVPT